MPTDGPTKVHVPTQPREGLRHPVNRDAFHRRERERRTKRIAPPRFLRVGPSLTPPPFVPEENGFGGPCKRLSRGHPRPMAFEERAPFLPAGKSVPGTDDPSTPAWLGGARPGEG
jgi:hypothetical protein